MMATLHGGSILLVLGEVVQTRAHFSPLSFSHLVSASIRLKPACTSDTCTNRYYDYRPLVTDKLSILTDRQSGGRRHVVNSKGVAGQPRPHTQ